MEKLIQTKLPTMQEYMVYVKSSKVNDDHSDWRHSVYHK